MEAGPELDRRIHVEVMKQELATHAKYQADAAEYATENNGRGVYMRCPGCDLHGYGNEVDWSQPCPTPACPPYSTDIAAAWQVVEKFIAAGCAAWVDGDGHTGYGAGCTSGRGTFETRTDSAPLAICLAALKTVEEA